MTAGTISDPSGDRPVEGVAILRPPSCRDRAGGFAGCLPCVGRRRLRAGLASRQERIQLRLAHPDAPLSDPHMAELARSIMLPIVCRLSFNSSATSCTVRSSSDTA